MATKHPNVLSIAGVDPSGGAGILADIKTMSALSAYATGVVTAVTAQNTQGVTGVVAIPTEFVVEQIDTLFKDVHIDAVKIGMLFDSDLIKAIAQRLRYWKPQYIVLDPVMVAKSGDALLNDDAVSTLRTELLEMSTIITPNLPEAARLLESEAITNDEQMQHAAERLWRIKGEVGWVYLKGGHRENDDMAEDFLYNGSETIKLKSKRTKTKNTHGTGCALSSALAALLPVSEDVPSAARAAKEFISNAIEHADELHVGHGHGPIMHFYKQWVCGK